MNIIIINSDVKIYACNTTDSRMLMNAQINVICYVDKAQISRWYIYIQKQKQFMITIISKYKSERICIFHVFQRQLLLY